MANRAHRGLSRRKFLTGTAAGLGTLGMMAVAPAWALGASGHLAAPAESHDLGSTSSAPLVAYVRDAAKGEVVIMVGTREVVRKDPSLVSRLARAGR